MINNNATKQQHSYVYSLIANNYSSEYDAANREIKLLVNTYKKFCEIK